VVPVLEGSSARLWAVVHLYEWRPVAPRLHARYLNAFGKLGQEEAHKTAQAYLDVSTLRRWPHCSPVTGSTAGLCAFRI
jgi:hypothetical protein